MISPVEIETAVVCYVCSDKRRGSMKKEITTFLMLVCISLPLFSQNLNFTLRSQFAFPDEKISVAGRQVLSGQIDSEAAVLELSPQLAGGIYFFYIQQDKSRGKTIKVVKI